MMGYLGKYISVFRVDYPKRLAYMWQSSEYSFGHMFGWWRRVGDFSTFTRRGDLVLTRASRVVRAIIMKTALLYVTLNMLSITLLHYSFWLKLVHLLVALLLYPIAVVALSTIPIMLLKMIKIPFDSRTIRRAKARLGAHPATVIAVAGSYGKTSCKELLVAVLSPSKKVKATTGNKNTLLSQAKFIMSLDGDEEYLIIEFGEGAPGDIQKMVDLTRPNYAVITGLAPNHLDRYKSLDQLAEDFAVLADYVGVDKTFMNADSEALFSLLGKSGVHYSSNGAFDGWTVYDLRIEIDKLSFELEKCGDRIKIDAKLVGEHNVGPLTFVIGFATMIGVPKKVIVQAVNGLEPYEHRMQPRRIHGAWFIDDTYNGNIDGMIAGLNYLKAINIHGRKMYATPGLVDQGAETESVHKKLGEQIANSGSDHVYLMQNSVTHIIETAMNQANYTGKLTIISDPLSFYTNIQDVLAKDDLILCQNDWPDIYN